MTATKTELSARIGIQHNGRVWLTIKENGREVLREQVSSRAVAELRINALEEARGQFVSREIETNL